MNEQYNYGEPQNQLLPEQNDSFAPLSLPAPHDSDSAMMGFKLSDVNFLRIYGNRPLRSITASFLSTRHV